MSGAKLFPRVHDLYLGRTVLGTVLLTWGVMLGLDVMLSLASELGSVGQGDYGVPQAVAHIAYTIPRRAYTLFPYVAVIGTLMSLGQLAATSELTALRAIGLSRRRLSLTVAVTLAVLTAVMVLNGETLGPWGQRQADMLKASSRSKDLIVARYSGVWAREGGVILNAEGGQERAEGGDRWLELNDVRLYEFDENGRLASLARVDVAEHRPGGWMLRGVERTTFGEASVTRERVEEESWDSQLDATGLGADIDRPRYLDSAALGNAIEYRRRNGLDASDFEEHYWGRWFYPINVLALCLAAIPFAFGSLRSGGLGRRLFIGVVFGLGFWLLQNQFVRLAGVYQFDFRIAYLIPPVLMLTISFLLFRRRSG